MYPEAFIEWIGDKGFYRIKGIWYTWPDVEMQDVPIAESTEELFKIWEEQNEKVKKSQLRTSVERMESINNRNMEKMP